MKKHLGVIITGVLVGLAALLLAATGNPGNMGFCIACFIRDTAGALGLHQAGAVQYFRPEIVGILLGAFIIALIKREFKPRGGSSPFTRLMLGFFVMVGALMFLGCPLRMALRIGGGDLNAIVGLVGFAAGILIGVIALNKGFTLKRTYQQSSLEGGALPIVSILLFMLFLLVPALFASSAEGPGSKRAFWLIALACGAVVGIAAQRSRLCMAGGFRDAFMFKDMHLLWGTIAIIATVVIGNVILGKFKLGFAEQSVAHTDWLWNFLGMALVGWASVLLGGCPLRQLVLAGEGNSDSAITVIGLLLGAAFCHNFGLASSAKGPTVNGMIAVIIGFIVTGLITLANISKAKK